MKTKTSSNSDGEILTLNDSINCSNEKRKRRDWSLLRPLVLYEDHAQYARLAAW